MKRRIYAMLFGLFLLSGQQAWAQKVAGVVKSLEDGQAIPGVTVVVKGTANATVTDIDGKYEIATKGGETLIFSLVGYKAQEVAIGVQSVIDIELQNSDQLGEVLVTGALGLKEDQRKLGFSVPVVNGADIAATQRDNFFDALQGRVAGLTVTTTSGAVGASSSLQLRGASSIGGNNQPLIVVDGLPIDNNTFGQGSLYTDQPNRQNDYTNRAADINPNDIASITVLKGPEAAALYGSQGSSGAIVITTKKGSTGRGKVLYDNSFGFDNVYRLPQVQTTYIRGLNGSFDRDVSSYFGPAKTDTLNLNDNIKNFFNTGKRQAHNLSFEAGSDRLSYRLSTNYTKAEGTIPNNNKTTLNARMAGTAKLLNNLEVNTSIAFISTELNKAQLGDGGVLTNLFRWPFYEDVADFRNPNGTIRRLQSAGIKDPNILDTYDNPNTPLNSTTIRDKTRRIQGNIGLTWTVTSWLSLTARMGADSYTTIGNYFNPPYVRAPALNNITSPGLGFIENYNENSLLLNGNFFAVAKKTFGDFSTTFLAGSAVDDKKYEVVGTFAERPFDPNFNSLNNFDPVTMRSKQTIKATRLLGLFGKLDIGYKDMLFLTVTGRNDWSSTLPIANRSYFYPSVSGAFEFTKLIKDQSILSYGKLRASYAQSGKDAPPFLVQPALSPQTSTGGGFLYGFFGGNPNLQPEFVTTREVGVELWLLKNRVKFDASYFSSDRSNQIATQRLSYGTGFVFGLLNSGSFNVNGVELSLTLTPLKTKDFKWDVVTNFTKNRTSVISLPADVNEFYNSDTWIIGNARASAFLPLDKLQASFPTLNLSYNDRGAGSATALGGYSYLRNKAGDVLINPTSGLPVINSNFLPIGDRQPDFTVGLINTFTWKGLSLRFNLDFRKGGDVFNGNELYLFSAGLSTRLLDRTQPYTFKGVLRDGKENSDAPTINTSQITPQTRSDFYGSFPESEFVERNINWMRLRDLSLSYQLPKSIMGRTKNFESISVFVSGTDLFLLTNYTGGDPAVNGTTAATAGVGAAGYDFGKIGANRSIAFGFKVILQ